MFHKLCGLRARAYQVLALMLISLLSSLVVPSASASILALKLKGNNGTVELDLIPVFQGMS